MHPERIVRFSTGSAASQYGMLSDQSIQPLSTAPWMGGKPTGAVQSLQSVRLLAPAEPSKIVCIGLNYHAHVAASQSANEAPAAPLIFLKPPSSVIGPEDQIIHPPESERVDYEAELGVVIGRTASKVGVDEAMQYVYGFTCVNDVTARDLQKKDGQWSRAKGFDTFCPIGPWVVTELSWQDTLVEGILNGQTMQSGRTSLMIFPVPFLISYISRVMTLLPGDVISTGTPAGIAPMRSGDVIEVKVDGVGCLRNRMA